MKIASYRSAVVVMLLALVGSVLGAAPALAASDCPSGQTQFKIDSQPSNGTYGDGTLSVVISNADSDSFSWASNIEIESVMVKAGPTLKQNAGGTGGTATSANNPNNGQPYGISHVSFCYTLDDNEEEDDDCEDRNGGKECDKEDDCEDRNGGKECDKEDDCEARNGGKECDEDDDCPDKGKGKGLSEDCGEEDVEDCPDGKVKGSKMGDDCAEVLPDVDKKPSRPAPDKDDDDDVAAGRIGSAPRPAPGTEVRGIRFSHRRSNRSGDDTEAQVAGRGLPSTGAAPLPYLVLGLGLATAGSLLWRRRRS